MDLTTFDAMPKSRHLTEGAPHRCGACGLLYHRGNDLGPDCKSTLDDARVNYRVLRYAVAFAMEQGWITTDEVDAAILNGKGRLALRDRR